MKPELILETCLYAADLEAVEVFYRDVLGLEPVTKAEGRHVFYRLKDQMLLIFNPKSTQSPSPDSKLPMLPLATNLARQSSISEAEARKQMWPGPTVPCGNIGSFESGDGDCVDLGLKISKIGRASCRERV